MAKYQHEISIAKSTKVNAIKGIKAALSDIVKQGVDPDNKLGTFLEESDFYGAPASTRYHLCCEGGLAVHTYHVMSCLRTFIKSHNYEFSKYRADMVAIAHDLCKVNIYHEGFRNKKDERGNWRRVGTWEVKDEMPLGHGEKSAFMLLKLGIRLTDEEIAAIRYHMGAYDAQASQQFFYRLGDAYKKYPLAVYLHLADMEATYTLDTKAEES